VEAGTLIKILSFPSTDTGPTELKLKSVASDSAITGRTSDYLLVLVITAIKYADDFEIREFGHQLTEDEIRKLFPLFSETTISPLEKSRRGAASGIATDMNSSRVVLQSSSSFGADHKPSSGRLSRKIIRSIASSFSRGSAVPASMALSPRSPSIEA
jgi:hypothetical protein